MAKSALWIMILALLTMTAAINSAQRDGLACPVAVPEAYAVSRTVCASVADGEACLGKGRVSVTDTAGIAADLATPGDRMELDRIERLQTRSMTADPQDWTALVARLDVTEVGGGRAYIDMIALGDVVVWRADGAAPAADAGETWPAAIEAEAGVLVRQYARGSSASIWQLRDGEAVQAIGRSGDAQWVRVLLPSPNGGAGWVFGRYVVVEGGSESLPFHTSFSPLPSIDATGRLAPTLFQSLRMESLPISDDCAEASDSGVLLQSPSSSGPVELAFNGVTMRLAGTAFLTAQIGGNMTVHNLEGNVGLIVNDQLTALPARTFSQTSLDNTMSPVAAPSLPQPFSEVLDRKLARLPLELLSRDIHAAQPQTSVVATPTCPGMIQETYDMTSTYCANIPTGQACVGNTGPGMLDAVPRAGVGSIDFDRPGASLATSAIERLSLSVRADLAPTWPAVMLRIDADTSGDALAGATVLLLGNVEWTNLGPASPEAASEVAAESGDMLDGVEATVHVAGSVRVLDQPRVDTDSVTLVDDQDTVLALQRSLDQQWIFIETAQGERGWLYAQFLRLPGDISQLPVYDPVQLSSSESAQPPDIADPPAYHQAFGFLSSDRFPGCADVPPGGMLIQSDSEIDGVLLLPVNGAVLELNGTAYLTATDDSLSIFSLEGAVSIMLEGAANILFAGQEMIVPQSMGLISDAEASRTKLYSAEDAARLASLPIQLLPRPFELVLPATEADSDAAVEQVAVADAAEVETPDSDMDAMDATSDTPAAECLISAGGLARNLRQGPGTDFDIVDVLRVGQSVMGDSQRRGTFGYYWYKTDRGWIRFDAGEMSAGCARLPFYIPEPDELARLTPMCLP